MNKRPKLSVIIIAYNHEKFISKAIDSVLEQNVDFEIEILIGEDDSQDDTRKIVLSYKKKYPNKIRVFLRERKDVIYINEKPSGRFNFINTIKEAKGEFIALLEGDDYWISSNKLQRQVDYLENNPCCSACFHSASRLNSNGVKDTAFYSPAVIKEKYNTEDLIKLNNFIPTASIVYKSGLFGEFPEWFYSIEVGDWPLHILNSLYGDIGYIDESMSMYRIHSGGIFSSIDETEKIKIQISLLWQFNKILEKKFKKQIKTVVSKLYLRISMEYDKEHDVKKARSFAKKSLLFYPYNRRFLVVLIKYVFRLYFARLHRFLKKVMIKQNIN